MKFALHFGNGTDGGSYFVIASKGGAPQHPGWYRNILANPDVEVQVGTKKMNARARTTASVIVLSLKAAGNIPSGGGSANSGFKSKPIWRL